MTKIWQLYQNWPEDLLDGRMTQSPSAGVVTSGVMKSDPAGSFICWSGVTKANCSRIGKRTGRPPTQLIMSCQRSISERLVGGRMVLRIEKESWKFSTTKDGGCPTPALLLVVIIKTTDLRHFTFHTQKLFLFSRTYIWITFIQVLCWDMSETDVSIVDWAKVIISSGKSVDKSF